MDNSAKLKLLKIVTEHFIENPQWVEDEDDSDDDSLYDSDDDSLYDSDDDSLDESSSKNIYHPYLMVKNLSMICPEARYAFNDIINRELYKQKQLLSYFPNPTINTHLTNCNVFESKWESVKNTILLEKIRLGKIEFERIYKRKWNNCCNGYVCICRSSSYRPSVSRPNVFIMIANDGRTDRAMTGSMMTLSRPSGYKQKMQRIREEKIKRKVGECNNRCHHKRKYKAKCRDKRKFR